MEHLTHDLKATVVFYDNSQHTHWHENLSPLTKACNSSWHKSTAATPALLFLSRELNDPLELKWHLYELEHEKNSKDVNESSSPPPHPLAATANTTADTAAAPAMTTTITTAVVQQPVVKPWHLLNDTSKLAWLEILFSSFSLSESVYYLFRLH